MKRSLVAPLPHDVSQAPIPGRPQGSRVAHLPYDVSHQADRLDFELPPSLEASIPPEARGLARDEVRLMVSYRSDDRIVHARFRQFGDFLDAGDLVVINTSGTMNAALNALREDGTAFELHLSTRLPGETRAGVGARFIGPSGASTDVWIVEVRTQCGKATRPFYDIRAGETLYLEGGAKVILRAPYDRSDHSASRGQHRLWIATFNLPCPLQTYLARYGFPIRYSYIEGKWPLDYYQTVYATEMGSAEMPSAGRAFTPEMITRLVAQGIQIAPLILHTGVASLEEDEPPYEEFYRVPPETARIVNATRAAGKRIVAVGTTVVRALETVTDETGTTHAGEGWTQLVVTPQRGMRAIDSLLTGLHEPHATHLWMLEALAGRTHLELTYAEALREGYLWHEFGDLHLILP